jgi:cupin 2 domain-containing protein
MKNNPVDSGNLLAPVVFQNSEEFFETLVEAGHVKIERIVSKGHATPPGKWYDQKRHEWVLLIKGAAGLRFEGKKDVIEMRPGDYIDIPARCRHRVEWTADQSETVWLTVFY